MYYLWVDSKESVLFSATYAAPGDGLLWSACFTIKHIHLSAFFDHFWSPKNI